jgi:hypothetical protein
MLSKLDTALGDAMSSGCTVASMQDDWRTVFPRKSLKA